MLLDHVLPLEEWPIYKVNKDKRKVLKEVVQESMENILAENQKPGALREEIAKTLYLEKIRIKKEPWEIDPPDEYAFWDKIKKKLVELDNSDYIKSQIIEEEKEILKKIINRYVHEMVGSFNPRIHGFARTMLSHFFNRLLSAGADNVMGFFRPRLSLQEKILITGPIEKVRKLSTKGIIILLPTHFSNLDSIMIGYGMDAIGLPAFQYGAGLNLFNNKFLGFFMGNLGAYKLDRRKKNNIYLETLKSFSRTNIYHGVHTLFFPGGTRSRGGNIEKRLKLGLLGTVMETQRRFLEEGNDTKIYILPMTISYHFVLEAQSLIEEHLKITGKELYITVDDEFASLRTISKFIYDIVNSQSDITLSLSDPMDVFGNKVDGDGNSIDFKGNVIDIGDYFKTRGEIKADKQREMEYTRILSEKVVEKFHSGNTVYNSHFVAFLAFELMRKKFSKADLFTFLNTPEEEREIAYDELVDKAKVLRERLFELENQGKLILSSHFKDTIDNVVNEGIRKLGHYHAAFPLKRTEYGEVTSENLKLLLFYRNRLDGYGLEKYIK